MPIKLSEKQLSEIWIEKVKNRHIGILELKTKWIKISNGKNQRHYLTECPKCNIKRWTLRRNLLYSMKTLLCGKCKSKESVKVMNKKRKILIGKEHPGWKGGTLNGRGYYIVTIKKDEPFFDMAVGSLHGNRKRILEHRLIMAKHLGRSLKSYEVVHHKNKIKTDNRIENLEIVNSRLEHACYNQMEVYIEKLEKKIIELGGTLPCLQK